MHDQPEGCPHYPSDKRPRRPFSSGARSSRRGLSPASTRRPFPFRAGRSGSHMRVGVPAIVPDLVSPEKSRAARFRVVCGFHSSRVTKPLSTFSPFIKFEQEAAFLVGSHKSSDLGAGRPGAVVVPVDPLVHFLADATVDNSVDGGVREAGVPCGGTGSKIPARRAGARYVIRGQRALPTGRLVQGQRVDDESRVAAAQGRVRFGEYTSPMTKMTSLLAVPAALATAVGR